MRPKAQDALRCLLIIACSVCGSRAGAIGLSEETQSSKNVFNQSLSVDRDFGGDGSEDSDQPWNWSLSYRYSKSDSNQNGVDIVDHTSDYSGTLDWMGESGVAVGSSIDYSWTPEELLTNRGGTVNGSYLWKYRDGASEFSPSFRFKTTVGATNYIETFNGTIPRSKTSAARPITGSEELRQTSIRPELTWAPAHDWRLTPGYELYSYNRNVSDFQSRLDSTASLRRGIGGFSNTVGGLPKHAYVMKVVWNFAEGWKARVNETFSIMAADGSGSNVLKGTIEYRFLKEWTATLGAEWDNSSSGPDVLAIAGLGWEN